MSKVKLYSLVVLAAFVLAMFGASSASYAGEPDIIFTGLVKLPHTKFITVNPSDQSSTTSTSFVTMPEMELSFWTHKPGCVEIRWCGSAKVNDTDNEMKIRPMVDGTPAQPGRIKAVENEDDRAATCFNWFAEIFGHWTTHDLVFQWLSNDGGRVRVKERTLAVDFNKWGRSGYCDFVNDK